MKRTLTFILLFFLTLVAGAKSFKISVDAGKYDRKNTVIRAQIPAADFNKGVRLFETTSGKKVECPCQTDGDFLYFVLSGETPKGTARHYLLQTVKDSGNDGTMGIINDGKALTLTSGGKKILSYVYTLTMPPAGVDEIYARSGFIHPAFTPSGFELTAIQPEDHRHHYGIWNPWTKIEYDGQEYDLWNLGDGKGTVRAREIISEYKGNVIAGFDAILDHNIKRNGGEKTIINETWKVRAWECMDGGFLWDFVSELVPSSNIDVIIKEYRYAGFGFRANKHWIKSNCEMVSSEGHHRSTIDGTRGKWIYTQGDTGNGGNGGLLMMAAPSNYNFPEPLRIWNENMSAEGYVFMNFAPTKNMDWNLEPGHKYNLCYRLFAFDGQMTPERAEKLWIDYAYPPKVEIQ